MKYYSLIPDPSNPGQYATAVTTGFRHRSHVTELPKDDNGNYVRQLDEIEVLDILMPDGSTVKQALWNKERRRIKINAQRLEDATLKKRQGNKKALIDQLSTVDVDSITKITEMRKVLKDVIQLLVKG